MDYQIIKSPSIGTKEMLRKRIGVNSRTDFDNIGAIGLVQGKLIEMVVASDIAEKAVNVTVEDIKGTCPQHMTLLGIFGDTASVEAAIENIKQKFERGKA